MTDSINPLAELLKSVDKDIETHSTKASEFIATVHNMLYVAVVVMAVYILPGIAERALPSVEADYKNSQESFKREVLVFEKNYKKAFYSVSRKEFDHAAESGSVSDEFRAAYRVSLESPNPAYVGLLRLLKALQVDDGKMESLFKILPIIFGAIMAGFLMTYRFHVQAAKEFTLKKMEILSKLAECKPSE